MSYRPEAGYAYRYNRGQWRDVMLSQSDATKAKWIGFRQIDGNRMGVFKVGRATVAQLAQNLVKVDEAARGVGKRRVMRKLAGAKRKAMPRKPRYTSLGGYTIAYYDSKGKVMCAKCATKYRRDVKHSETYDEGDPLECSRCDAEIESSYGPVSDRAVGRGRARRAGRGSVAYNVLLGPYENVERYSDGRAALYRHGKQIVVFVPNAAQQVKLDAWDRYNRPATLQITSTQIEKASRRGVGRAGARRTCSSAVAAHEHRCHAKSPCAKRGARRVGAAGKPTTRKALEAAVWKHTHRDFKGKFEDGTRTILVGDPKRGTILKVLGTFTDDELRARLPASQR